MAPGVTADLPADTAVADEFDRRRDLQGPAVALVALIGALFSLFQIHLAARGFIFELPLPGAEPIRLAALQQLQINAVHVGLALVLTFLMYPGGSGHGRVATMIDAGAAWLRRQGAVAGVLATPLEAVRWVLIGRERDRVTPIDWALIGVVLLAVWYYLSEFDEILRMRALGLDAGRALGEVYPVAAMTLRWPIVGESSWAYLLGLAAFLLVLEATRRALSVYLMAIIGAFGVYAKYAYLIPRDIAIVAPLSTPEASWATIVRNFWYTDQGILGIPVLVSVQFIYIFILFGAFLEQSGAGRWLIDLAYTATARRRGGPAKASILASGFMGTISGSSIANTVTTGAFTIPLMKRSGYRPEFAGGVEASASSGGQVLPPVMGAAAFLIVEFTLTPYADVIVAATVPAVVFFVGVWVMVHYEAGRVGIGGHADLDIPSMAEHLRAGWFYLAPIILLLYLIIIERLTVARSAWFTLVAIMGLIALMAADGPETRRTLVGVVAAVTGVGVLLAITMGTDPLAALVGSSGWVAIIAGVVTMLLRPGAPAPLVSYDRGVTEAAAAIGDRVGRPALLTGKLGHYGTFIGRSLTTGAETATVVVIAVAAAGVIPGVVATTGLGPNLVSVITTVAGGSLVLLLIITAIGAVILGMGMPTTVTYIILVSLLAPAVTAVSDIPILAVHLFILYFGVIADITPPVAVAAYAAAGVAKANPFETGITAFSLSLNKVIVPFAFVFSPGILLLRPGGDGAAIVTLGDLTEWSYAIPEIYLPIATMTIGVIALAATIIGHQFTTVSRVARVGFAGAALLMMAPQLLTLPLGIADAVVPLRLTGVGLFILLSLRNRRRSRQTVRDDTQGGPALDGSAE
jgi:TRAP transporter 4TM/12TM fusion protein